MSSSHTHTGQLSFTLPFDEELADYLEKNHPEIKKWRVLSQNLDARGAPRGIRPKFHYQIEFLTDPHLQFEKARAFPQFPPLKQKPLIIGAGPAGLYCAVTLAEHGIPSVILERGDSAQQRMLKISQFWRYGKLDEDSNVCFGEGGAGLYSDGKLITRVKSAHIPYVMEKLVDFGAPAEVAYISNPHLGSNKIRAIITRMTDWLKSKGCEIRHRARVESILLEGKKVIGVELSTGEKIYSDWVVLAAGHSSHGLYRECVEKKIAHKLKDFAVGVRVEHPRELIDRLQHGQFCASPLLGAARYRLSWHDQSLDRGVYSFCMCPGGYVLSSGTESDGIVVNGMSNYARNSPWSNSAFVVSVKAQSLPDAHKNSLAGLDYQRKIEKLAYQVSAQRGDGRMLPSMSMADFFEGRLKNHRLPPSSSPSKLVAADLAEILPLDIREELKKGFSQFDRQLKGFISSEAVIMAPETRTSSPLTLLRDPLTFESQSHEGLYPCGEGAGYAGGITSAAVDGVRVAYAIMAQRNLLPVQAP